MAKKTIIPQAVNLINEICDLVRTYVIDNKSKRNFCQYDFCKETGISSNIYGHLNGNKQGGMNLNSACLLLDAIGYELKIVKKEDKKIVKYMKGKNMKEYKYYLRKNGNKYEICDPLTDQRVSNEPPVYTYEKAKWRVNELNGVENEGFEPIE